MEYGKFVSKVAAPIVYKSNRYFIMAHIRLRRGIDATNQSDSGIAGLECAFTARDFLAGTKGNRFVPSHPFKN